MSSQLFQITQACTGWSGPGSEVGKKHQESTAEAEGVCGEEAAGEGEEGERGGRGAAKEGEKYNQVTLGPKTYKVVQVEGSKVTARRGEEKMARAKNHVKVVKIRPDYLRVKSKHQTKSRQEEELDLEVSEDTLERMRYPAGRSRARGTGGGATGSARGPSPQAGSSAGLGSHAG